MGRGGQGRRKLSLFLRARIVAGSTVKEYPCDAIPAFDANPPESRDDGGVDYSRGGSSHSKNRITCVKDNWARGWWQNTKE